MNGRRAKIEITEADYEKMCLLAEDVMQQLYMHYSAYDEDGNDIFEKYYKREGDWEENKEFMHKEEFALMETCENKLLYELFRRGDEIGKVRYYTLEDIQPWIDPILPKALKLFRKGTGDGYGETDFVAASAVPDDYLTEAFSREVRNMMMIFAGQRLHDE